MIRTRAVAVAAVLALTLVAAACGGGSSSKKTPSAAGGEPTIPSIVHTGDGSVDHTLDAALVPDTIELARLVRYEKVACAAQEDDQHPGCGSTLKPGDLREVFRKTGCDRGWVSPEDVPAMFAGAFPVKGAALLAVYHPASSIDTFGAQYVGVIASGKHSDGTDAAVALHVKDGRIVTMEDDCGGALRLLDQSRVVNWVIKPGQGNTATPPATGSP